MHQEQDKRRKRAGESHSELIKCRQCDKDGNHGGRAKYGNEHGLQEDGVMNLPQCWLLDPDFTVKYLSHEVSLVVLCNPGLGLVPVLASEAVEGVTLERVCIFCIHKQFPGMKVPAGERIHELWPSLVPLFTKAMQMAPLTMHKPFEAKNNAPMPAKNGNAAMALHARGALLTVRRTRAMKPPMIQPDPRN